MEFPVYIVDGDNYLDRRNLPLNTVVPKGHDGWRSVYQMISDKHELLYQYYLSHIW